MTIASPERGAPASAPARVAAAGRTRPPRVARPTLIAYDLRFAEDSYTGIGTHAYSLLDALLALPGDERYGVIWDDTLGNSRFDFEPIRRHPRVTWVEGRFAPRAVPSLWKIGKLLRDLDASVYLSPFYFMPLGAGCPCVLTLHDVWPLRWPQGLRFWPRTLYQLSIARTTGARFVLTSSEFSRREIAELSALQPEQVRVVTLGVPASGAGLEPRRPSGLPEGPYALVVGINKPHKNLSTLVAAWSRFGASPALRLVSAGPEDRRHPGLGRLATVTGAHKVTALGRVGEDELDWLYRHAELVLFPTLYEGFGLPMVEAFARGTPVIASDIPTLRETGEGIARFVPPLDVAAWAAAICEVARGARDREAMARAGLERARELTYERTARATLEVLREALTPAEVEG